MRYVSFYGYRWRDALVAEFWWRIEHCGWNRLEDFGYRQRKAAERKAVSR